MQDTKPNPLHETIVSKEYLEFMREDHEFVVIMAIPTNEDGMFSVTYISRECGDIPSWIIDRKAA